MDFVYKNPSALIEERVKDLLSRMTLEEKIGQMTQIERSVATPSVITDLSIGKNEIWIKLLSLARSAKSTPVKDKIGTLRTLIRRTGPKWRGTGSILSVGGSAPFEDAPSEAWAYMVDGFQKAALESRLGIPLLYGVDAIHGNNNVYGATIFPQNVGLGATRDADLVQKIGIVTALEVRACGINYTFAPCVAVCRDPRWGRCYESYGEDTELIRKMTSIVTGLQGQPPRGYPQNYPFLAGRDKVVACAKHFVGDGGTDRGINEGNTISSYDDLERIHIAPYIDCISQGVCTVMASYSKWNGSHLHSSHFLLTEVLKGKLGFKGFVISDSEGLDRFFHPHGSNYDQSILAAVNAGIDMVMVPFRYQLFLDHLKYLVESGEIPMTRIDDAVERILRVKFVSGAFENPLSDRSLLDTVGCNQHRELAREAVRKSLVLLKNGKDVTKPFLPLVRKAKRILVAGKHADDLGFQCGGWTKTWEGMGGRITIGTTILEAIKDAVGGETELVYEENPLADTFASQDFSYSIVAVGEPPYCESGGDSQDLRIPLGGEELISLVADRVPTLVILISGRPLYIEPLILEKMDAFVAAWLPGTEGTGITDVIFGDFEFHGRLPMTWFKSVDQLPLHQEQNSYEPLFPFGYGLTSKNKVL